MGTWVCVCVKGARVCVNVINKQQVTHFHHRSVVEFSLLRCREFVAQQSHLDVDTEPNHIWEHQWDQFLTDFYLVCHENSKIQVKVWMPKKAPLSPNPHACTVFVS